MNGVDFVGPPPRHKNTKHARIASTLKARPKTWGVVLRCGTITRASAAAQAIRSARLPAYEPAGSFEARARTVIEKGRTEHRVYARYVGGGK